MDKHPNPLAFPFPYSIEHSKPTKAMKAERVKLRKQFTKDQFKVIDLYWKEASRRGWSLAYYCKVFEVKRWSEFIDIGSIEGDRYPTNCVVLDKQGKSVPI